MGKKQVIHDVSDDEIDDVVSNFENTGATVNKYRQDNGRWTVEVEFDVEPDRPWPRK